MAGWNFRGQMSGTKEAVALLSGMRRQFRNRILRKALRAGAKPIISLARSFVRVKTGTYRRSIGVAIKTFKGSGAVVARIAARQRGTIVIDGVKVNPVYYSHLEEEGRAAIDVSTAKVLTDAGRGAASPTYFGKHVKAMAGSHAFRRAYDSGKGLAVEEINRVIVEELAAARGKALAG